MSSWATPYLALLASGKEVKFRPRGNSMSGKIESGQLCTVKPVTSELTVDMIVLCRVKGAHYLHLISAITHKRHKDGTKTKKFQISNAKGFINGWVNEDSIYGILTKVEA